MERLKQKDEKYIENCKNTTGNKVRSECEEESSENKNGWKKEQKISKQKDERYIKNCEKITGNKVRNKYEERS